MKVDGNIVKIYKKNNYSGTATCRYNEWLTTEYQSKYCSRHLETNVNEADLNLPGIKDSTSHVGKEPILSGDIGTTDEGRCNKRIHPYKLAVATCRADSQIEHYNYTIHNSLIISTLKEL